MRGFNFFSIIIFLFLNVGFSQDEKKSDMLIAQEKLFEHLELLPVRIKYSSKALKKETNDSTFMDSELVYKMKNGDWKTLNLKIRARGNFRKKSCYFTPLKLKIKKSEAKATIFKGEKKLKMVLPCLNESSKDDNVIKEYLIYKMFEVVSPYYFSTRLLEVEFSDTKNKRPKTYDFKGFLIEDDSKVAKRLDAKVGKRKYYPEAFDNLATVRNAMFHYMVGNTDFSVTNQHNTKVLYVDKKFVPVPYDFDMAGFVNTSYSVVSQTRKMKLPIEGVTQRYYMGYQRDYKYFQQIRQEFLSHKKELLAIVDDHKSYFESEKSFEKARIYIEGFFKVLVDETRFKKRTYDIALKMN